MATWTHLDFEDPDFAGIANRCGTQPIDKWVDALLSGPYTVGIPLRLKLWEMSVSDGSMTLQQGTPGSDGLFFTNAACGSAKQSGTVKLKFALNELPGFSQLHFTLMGLGSGQPGIVQYALGSGPLQTIEPIAGAHQSVTVNLVNGVANVLSIHSSVAEVTLTELSWVPAEWQRKPIRVMPHG
jgi:hypothetical protein